MGSNNAMIAPYLEAVLEAIPSAIALVDASAMVVSYVNRRARQLCGADFAGHAMNETLAGLNVRRLDGSPYPIDEMPITQAVGSGHHSRNLEMTIDRADGLRIPVVVSAAPLLDGAGHIAAAIVVFDDISERKRAEEARRQSEERLALALSAGRLGIWDWRLDGDLIWDDQTFRILGYQPGEIKPSRQAWGDRLHPDDRARAEAVVEQSFLEPGDYTSDYRVIWPDGSIHWITAFGHVEFSADNRPARSYGVRIDVTDHKLAEEALLQANQNLEKRVLDRTGQIRSLALELGKAEQRERKRLALLLHDHLQQLLVGAKLSLGIVKKRAGGQEILADIGHVNHLLDEAINASKSLTFELSPPILHQAGLVAALGWLGRWMAEKHGLNVQVSDCDEIAPDPGGVCMLLFQCVRELLFNVAKHSGTKCARVSIGRTNHHIQITVADDGAGFDAARAREYDSSGGFGLFSIRERLLLIGGQMHIDSSPTQGTRVSLLAPVPASDPQPASETPASCPVRFAPPARNPEAPPRKTRVLVADDHAIMRQGLTQLLRIESDFDIVGEAADGLAAVEMAVTLQPDVVIMDMSMPRMNGIEATRRIKSACPQVQVIGLSMFEQADRAGAMIEAGASAFLHKAGPSADLIAAIRAHGR